MPATKLKLSNKTSHSMHFHLEPNCTQIELPPGKDLEISGVYDLSPIEIWFSDDDEFGIFGAIFPGDGSVTVVVDGRDTFEG